MVAGRQRVRGIVLVGLVSVICGGSLGAQERADPPVEKKSGADARAVERAGVREFSGIDFAVLESYIRRSLASGSKMNYGFKIRRVAESSAAAKAGLRKGDILLEWDGKPVRRVAKLCVWMAEARKDGKTLIIKYARLKRTSIFDRYPWKVAEATIKLTAKKKPKFRIY